MVQKYLTVSQFFFKKKEIVTFLKTLILFFIKTKVTLENRFLFVKYLFIA